MLPGRPFSFCQSFQTNRLRFCLADSTDTFSFTLTLNHFCLCFLCTAEQLILSSLLGSIAFCISLCSNLSIQRLFCNLYFL